MKTFFERMQIIAVAIVFLTAHTAYSQFTVTPNRTAAQLANALTGAGVTVSNASLTCPSVANGTFVGGPSPLGISNGIVLTSGTAVSVDNPASYFASPEDNGAGGDANLTTLSGNPTLDACVLEFDFVPFGDSIKFNYQFGSEEYTDYTCSQYNDVFGFFISGPGYAGPTNIALVPGTNIPVAINSINKGTPSGSFPISNCTGMGTGSPFPAYFINNASGSSIAYNGLTRLLTAKAAVIPCSTYHFKLGVADATDRILSSGVFLQSGSLTVLPPVISGCPSDINVNTTSTTCDRSVSWTPPTSNNNCLDVNVSSTHNPGDLFPLGTTTVTYTFSNAGGSSTCSFNVTVTDNVPPTAMCTNYTLNLVNGAGTVTPANVDNGSTDNCSIASMSVSPNSFTCADAGDHTVTLTVTDGSGNTSSCTAVVTVQYQPTCSVSVAPGNNVYTGGNPNVIYLGYGPQTATLTANAIGGSGFTYSWAPGTGLSCTNCQSSVFTPTTAGNYTFTATATNSNGCSTTCAVTICVLDIKAPTNGNNVKIYVCHIPEDNPSNEHTLSVSINSVAQHLAHGDRLGRCDQSCSQNKGVSTAMTEVFNSEIQVYPNPATGTFMVQLPNGIPGQEAVVMDMNSRVIERKTFSGSNKVNFDLTKEAAGMYMIQIIDGTNVYRTTVNKQ